MPNLVLFCALMLHPRAYKYVHQPWPWTCDAMLLAVAFVTTSAVHKCAVFLLPKQVPTAMILHISFHTHMPQAALLWLIFLFVSLKPYRSHVQIFHSRKWRRLEARGPKLSSGGGTLVISKPLVPLNMPVVWPCVCSGLMLAELVRGWGQWKNPQSAAEPQPPQLSPHLPCSHICLVLLSHLNNSSNVGLSLISLQAS